MNENCWYKEVCQEQCNSACIRYLEMQYLLDNSGIPKTKQRKLDLYPDNEDYEAYVKLATIKDNILDVVRSGRNVYLTSKITGNGKTTWAIKLLLKYFDLVWAGNGFRCRGVFVHVPTLLLQLKNFENRLSEEYKKNILTADLVVWDDIASTDISNYDYSQLLMYIDQRYINEKANIFTGNINSKAALEKALGSKLTSRIWLQSEVIEFKGTDKRNGGNKNYTE